MPHIWNRFASFFAQAGQETAQRTPVFADDMQGPLRALNAQMLDAIEQPGGLLEAIFYLVDRGRKTTTSNVLLATWDDVDARGADLHVACEHRTNPAEKRDVVSIEVTVRHFPVMVYRRLTVGGVSHREGYTYPDFSNWIHHLQTAAQQAVLSGEKPTQPTQPTGIDKADKHRPGRH